MALAQESIFPIYEKKQYKKLINRIDVAFSTMDERGPCVIYSDLKGYKIPRSISKEVLLQTIAMNTIVALGQGHAFNEGVYDLPAGHVSKYRLLVISKRDRSLQSDDHRLRDTNLINIMLFVPVELARQLPNYSVMEEEILSFLDTFENYSNFVEEDFLFIKMQLMSIITNFLF